MSEPFGKVDELEDRRMFVGTRVDELVDGKPQYLANDRRQLLCLGEERLQIPVEAAPHLDAAVGELRGEGAIAFAAARAPRAIIEGSLRAAFDRRRAGHGKNVAHNLQRKLARVHGNPERRRRYSSPLIFPRFGATSSSIAAVPSGATWARSTLTVSPSISARAAGCGEYARTWSTIRCAGQVQSIARSAFENRARQNRFARLRSSGQHALRRKIDRAAQQIGAEQRQTVVQFAVRFTGRDRRCARRARRRPYRGPRP